ncbi:ATP-binding protein [Allonocardiopsis opalescens]|uniref:Anti-sigma regulatory factor (Ser/Thr protein kinase) n=1 Tax=Allonocardiopsis opalescens TaxID=1144618 RepID=A0A2T0PV80_9ACTN|nr:ATP-binding protein [Allonocardiopsis opalescens]PRX95445.1 anti-sigma regulatory factor (Ser/Thr protein kinase) [Allonocardiopsis opalescens]
MIALGGAVIVTRGTADRAFPGLSVSVAEARNWLRQVLTVEAVPAGVVDIAVLLLSEVATNAVTHTESGAPGGRFVLRVRCGPGWLRIECDDAGNRTGSHPRYVMSGPEEVGGRGLALVAELADAFGDRFGFTGRTVYFELHWPNPSGRSPLPARRGY